MFKVGDEVKVLKAFLSPELVGKIRKVVRVDYDQVYLEGNTFSWNQGTDSLKIIESNTMGNTTTNVLDFFRNLAASEEEKLLKKLGLENPIGTPTEEGLKIATEMNYKAHRNEIIELAKKMDEAQKKEEKK